ncbi:hypothetical protein PC9H_000927 [Pleurotus ostreatus]|uniref:Uncharacterized protein n=1 Tax=Pleurotus ostreatus TaxID=5322 RepID=A0A8H7A5X3_PLEOS|nr:uncharacterized protein PC9H_000927 [Pleurotus ostreatus]KAF7440581.1 hypothetical protein PC9H_000927 [Pleurotus ostreatus]KAJ8700049.1 hypothetical protein PTI98_003115 [Pleurotus ostreatus]
MPVVPTVEEIEEYLESLEELLFSSLSIPEVPSVREAVNRLWLDISRYGPSIPSLQEGLPTLGVFQVPPPPPPPPPPPLPESLFSHPLAWAAQNPWKASGLAVGIVGTGLFVGYSSSLRRASLSRKKLKASSNERRQVVVVLGGDLPLGLPLIRELENKGYIVITSVTTPHAVTEIESQCNGYVRALILDPYEPATIPVFLRSLTSTLARRFPLTASGDLYASARSHPYIHSVISLLTLMEPVFSAPLEQIALHIDYLPYLTATHITPLQVFQCLLPLLRTGAAAAQDKGKKTMIVCLPVTAARVGLPFASMQAMASAATLRGIEVLRREIDVAALTDKTESMKNIKVVAVDVGAFDLETSVGPLPPHDVYRAMEGWSASEKMVYGPAYASLLHQIPRQPRRSNWLPDFWSRDHLPLTRSGAGVHTFVEALASIVSDGRIGLYLFGLGPVLRRLHSRMVGKRIVVGAGAMTYKLASYLPTTLLDTLLIIPHFLISVRNSLLPMEPFVQPPETPANPPPGRLLSDSEHEDISEDSSDADAECSPESTSESWVSLKDETADQK